MMERLTEWKDDKKLLAKAKFSGDFGSQNILQSLAEYEDLEELIGIPLKNLAEICKNKIPEECRNPKKAIVLTDEDVDRWNGYRDLEDRLHGISIKQVVDGFIKTVENQTHEGYENGRILTNEDADRWNEYKNEEEQGLLLRLPCGIGADIYFIPSKTNYKLNILHGYPESNRVYHQNVEKISFTQYGWYLECDKDIEYATGQIFIDKSYKETWFLTQEEAEQKLKEMESD